jgi:hypothetical protein
MRLWTLPMLAMALACSGSRDVTAPAEPADAAAPPAPPAPAPAPAGPPAVERLILDGGDEAETLRRLGAVPAWSAVVERGRYLARRGEQGVVFGRLGGAVAEPGASHRWLIDDTEGEGALAIRLSVDPLIALAEGQRLVAWGAWELDAERRWYWRAERVALLEAAGGQPPTVAERFAIPVLERAPETAVPVSELTADGEILFAIRGAPRDPTDGWEVIDPGGLRAVGRLLLPGEQQAYGRQEYRAPDEHWRLAPDTVYTVPVRRQRAPRPGALPILHARAIPRRVEKVPRAPRSGARLQPAQQGAEQRP